MKKYLYIAIAAATFASCSQDEVLEVAQKEAISFGNAFVGNATRGLLNEATDPSYTPTSLAYFDVYGTVTNQNIYKDVRVTKNSHAYGEAWDIAAGTPTQYWVDGASYIFDAVVDATSVTTDNSTGLPTSLNYNTNNQKDMLYNRVTTTGKPTTNNGIVTFNFTHLLSKVKFTVANTNAATATNYRYSISNISITNANLVGDYAVPAGTWSITTKNSYSVANITEITSGNSKESAAEVLLIPSQGTEKVGVTFTVNVEYQKAGSTTWETIKSDTKTITDVISLAANNAYNFYIEVGLDQPIQFTANQLPDWDYDINNDDVVDADDNIEVEPAA